MADLFLQPLGGFGPVTTGTIGFTNFSLDGSTDAIEVIFQAQEAATITHLGFRYAARTGTPPTYRISLQGVSSGVPDGTVKGGGSPASATFTPPADTTWNNTWQWVALDNSYTTTRGELLAWVIEYSSGTVSAAHFSSITQRVDNVRVVGLPYSIDNAAGSRSRRAVMPCFGYKSSTKVYGFPVEALTLTQYSSDSTNDEFALRFVVPSGASTTLTCAGVRAKVRVAAAAKSVAVTLYEGTTALQTVTWDQDDSQANNTELDIDVWFDEVTLSSLTVGSVYRIGFAPQETAANFAVRTIDVDSNAELSAFPGGVEWYLSTRADGGAWTDDTTRRPLVEPILADVTATGGSGGGGPLIGGRLVR